MALVQPEFLGELDLYLKRAARGLPTTPKDIRKLQARARYLRIGSAGEYPPAAAMRVALRDFNSPTMPRWAYTWRPGEKPS